MNQLREKVFKANLILKVTNLDALMKQLAHNCVSEHNVSEPRDLFSYLGDSEEKFWRSVPGIVPIILQWFEWAGSALEEEVPSVHTSQLQHMIWINFVRRLSLEPGLICNNKKAKDPHGNITLRLFVQVVEETLYSQFKMVGWKTSPCTNGAVTLQADTTSHNNQYKSLFESQFDNNIYKAPGQYETPRKEDKIYKAPDQYEPYTSRKEDNIHKDQDDHTPYTPRKDYTSDKYDDKCDDKSDKYDVFGHDEDNDIRIKSRLILPRTDTNGLQVKLHRYPNRNSKPRKISKRKSDEHKSKRAYDDEDDEDDSE
jgi:hypothetical protein